MRSRTTLGAGLVLAALVTAACDTAGTAPTTTVLQPSVVSFVVETTTTSTLPGTPTVATTVVPALPSTTASTTSTSSTSTTNPAVASVTIAHGDFITENHGSCTPTSCKRVLITTSGWPKFGALDITCYSSAGPTGPYTKYADKSGAFTSSTLCFYGNVTNVYVVINGVSSNVISPWKDW